jgi:lysophospholipase L1-like esterase
MPIPLRYLALGDSYTIGEAVPAASRWPVQLVAKLRQRGMAIDDPRIVATTGWSTDELSAGMDAASLAPPYDLVSLLIGVNNQYRGRHADEYRDQFRSLLQRAIALAGHRASRVIVVSIPDWGTTPFARQAGRDPAQIGHALDTFNAIVRDEANRAGTAFVDITGISRQHPELTAEDGLHPSAAQYTLWTHAIEPIALERLQTPR